MPNRGIAECPNRGRIYVDGVPRGRADTPGFYRRPEIEGQQVTEFGVPPLPRKNTQQEARLFCAGFLRFLRRQSTIVFVELVFVVLILIFFLLALFAHRDAINR